MSHAVWFRAPLTCADCGSFVDGRETGLHTSSFGTDSVDTNLVAGGDLDLDLDDFDAGYLTLRPPQDKTIHTLERWGCPVCRHAQWAGLEFERVDPEHTRFLGARTVTFDADALRDVHYVSRMLDLWVEGNPGAEADRVMEVAGHLLPWLKRGADGRWKARDAGDHELEVEFAT